MPILYSCQQATRLIEERADRPLSPLTASRLAVHLAYCPYCRRYAQQSPLIAQLALFAAQRTAVQPHTLLPADVRSRIERRLNEHLDRSAS